MDETITLNLTGFHVEGTARVLLWNGDVAEVEMNAFHVDSLDDIPKNINDGQFGCQRILSAKCLVYKDYEGRHTASTGSQTTRATNSRSRREEYET